MADKRTRLSDISRAGKKAEKPTVIGAIRDPQFVRDVLQGLGETATRGITGVLGAPVDITTMAMRPFGYSVPAEQVVGGSEYLGKQLERAGMLSGNRNQLSELLAGLVTPDPLDVAKLGAMAVPAVGRAMKAPRDEALKIAQANAAKPVSEGGLGLPSDNTATDRAKAMGYDVDAYHGTTKDFPAFDPEMRGTATDKGWYGSGEYSAPRPDAAEAYTMSNWPDYKEGANIIPVLLKNPESISNKYGSVTEYVTRNPNQIRSRFAAFDPARRYESDLLGAADPRLLGAIGLGTAGAIYKTNREKEKDRKREK
jgi:hypothetical protein